MTKKLRILQVEDNPADADLTREMFSTGRLQVEIVLVVDGIEALAYLRRQGEYEHAPTPNLILLDLNLPRKDGRDVLLEIKRDAELKKLPVIIFSSSDAEVDIVESYRLGTNCYITKPSSLGAFSDVVKRIEDFWFTTVKLPAHDRGQISPEVPPSDFEPGAASVILLAEDCEADADLVREYFEDGRAGDYRFVHVTQLSGALEVVRSNPISLILLDLGLPDCSGVECVRILNAEAREVPIIVLTGNEDEQGAYLCLEAGAEDYLLKSEMTPRSIRRAVRYAISRRRDFLERVKLQRRLEESLSRALSDFLCVCASCRKVREGKEWIPLERYVATYTNSTVSHGICPDCLQRKYPGAVDQLQGRN